MTGWRARAACRPGSGVSPEVFYPVSMTAKDQVADARAVCRSCPVRTECLDDAVATRDVHFGIRGGLIPDERRALARAHVRADRAAVLARAVAAAKQLGSAALAALDGAGPYGDLPERTRSETRRALIRAGLAYESMTGRRHGSAVRLNPAGRALRDERRTTAGASA